MNTSVNDIASVNYSCCVCYQKEPKPQPERLVNLTKHRQTQRRNWNCWYQMTFVGVGH